MNGLRNRGQDSLLLPSRRDTPNQPRVEHGEYTSLAQPWSEPANRPPQGGGLKNKGPRGQSGRSARRV